MGEGEALSWLKAMPQAPEFRPTEAEFADPIAYILKIEKEASQYGICKIIPPIPKSSKKSVIANLNLCLGQQSNNTNSIAATGLHPGPSVNNNVLVRDNGVAKFTTRQQQIGWSLKRSRGGGPVQTVVQKSVWQSGETYTLEQFEAKAKLFSRSRLKTSKDAAPLMVETLFWKATADKPITVEYANDIPGTAFGEPDKNLSPPSSPPSAKRKRKKQQQCKQKNEEGSHDACDISNTAWNMRIVSRSDGSLLRYMPVEVAGVTSPMIYIAMLFSWFAWHVEDHDLHSLNYLHMGAPKTWYAVPGEAASAFEEVVRREGYGGQVNPLVAFAMLGEKTTVMSPEVLIAASVPCCRLVQNAGEFVITFPRAYHLGFSHGFNCGEAANLATPEWLKVAKEAAVRRGATKFLPMLSHQQLLYLLALGSTLRIPMSVASEPRSSRLKYRKRGEGEMIVKKAFLDDVIENNHLLSILLRKTSTHHAVLWNSANVSCDFPYSPLCFPTISEKKSSASLCMDGVDVSALPSETALTISIPACVKEELCTGSSLETAEKEPSSRIGSSLFNNVKQEDMATYYANLSSLHDNNNDKGSKALIGDISSSETDIDTGPLACTVCGVLGFASMAVIQPCQEAATVLLSTNYKIGQNYVATDGAETALTHSRTYLMDTKDDLERKPVQLNQHGAAYAYKDTHAYQHVAENMDLVDVKPVMQIESLGSTGKKSGIFSESFKQKESIESSIPNDACMPETLTSGNNSGIPQKSALDLLAAAYGDAMDSDEENDTIITNTSNHACDASNGALVFENSHDLCDAADAPKVNVFVSKDPNLQESPHFSSCALAGKVRKEEINDVLISGGLKPDNKCPFVNTDIKDSFSNSMRTDTGIAGESSICSPDQCLTGNATFHSSVSEDWNDSQGEVNVSGIQFPVMEGNNKLQKHSSLAPECETGIDNTLHISLKETHDSSVRPSSQLGDPSEASGSSKEPSGMVVSSTRDSKGDLTQMELSSKKLDLKIMSESKYSTKDTEAGKSDLNCRADCSETQYVYDCQPVIQVPMHYEPKEMCSDNDGNISMSVRSNRTQACDVLVANMSHIAEAGSLPDKISDMPREITNASSLWEPAKGFLRPRVFCLEHALEIQEQLQPMGGAHFLILCHLSYPKMEQQARLLAAELGNNYSWKDIPFKKVTSEDLEVIHSASDDGEDTETRSNDWTVQLGVSLHYSVKLSKSPLYSKQMPYNPILEALFFNSYLNNYSDDSAYRSVQNCDMNKQGKKSKHKKITVAGKWCGRVWMVNQVHPYLRNLEIQPSAFLAAKTIQIGASQEQEHLQKCMGQDADCKPILKARKNITSDKDIVALQDGSHFQKDTIQDPDSKLLKPRMSITSDKIITFTPSEQPLTTYTKKTHNLTIYTRSGVKGKMCPKRQIDNITAQLSEHKTVSVDERTPLPNQPKESQEDSIIKTDTVAFSTHSELNKDAEPTPLYDTRMKQMEKVVEHRNCVHANHTDYQEDMSELETEIQHTKGNFGENTIQNKTSRQSVVKDEVGVPPTQGSQVQCLENTLISSSHTVSHSCSSAGELEGGPCTRLRPRSSKPKVEVVNRVADKALQQSVSSKTISKGKKKLAKSIPSKNGEDKNIYCCDTEGCTMKFSSKHDLNLHKRNICTFKGCGKHFFSHKYLVQHRRVHLDERPLSCPWEGCEMTFKWAWARTEHIRVHTGERPYVCTTAGCGQTFRFVSDFSRHKRKTGHLQKK